MGRTVVERPTYSQWYNIHYVTGPVVHDCGLKFTRKVGKTVHLKTVYAHKEDAVALANRLAKKYPGRRYYVTALVYGVSAEDPVFKLDESPLGVVIKMGQTVHVESDYTQ